MQFRAVTVDYVRIVGNFFPDECAELRESVFRSVARAGSGDFGAKNGIVHPVVHSAAAFELGVVEREGMVDLYDV
nr:hypothetical protein [Haladaptatus pallidirubidus]